MREAEDYMNDSMRKKIVKPYQVRTRSVHKLQVLAGGLPPRRITAPLYFFRLVYLRCSQIGAGLVPGFVLQWLPREVRHSSAFWFGTPANSDLTGLPAAAIRMLHLTHSQVAIQVAAFTLLRPFLSFPGRSCGGGLLLLAAAV